jgi:hypothetical protein
MSEKKVEKLSSSSCSSLCSSDENEEKSDKKTNLIGQKILFECMDGSVKTIFDEHLYRFDALVTWLSSRVVPSKTTGGGEEKLPTFFLDYCKKDVMNWLYVSKGRHIVYADGDTSKTSKETIEVIDTFLLKNAQAKLDWIQGMEDVAQEFVDSLTTPITDVSFYGNYLPVPQFLIPRIREYAYPYKCKLFSEKDIEKMEKITTVILKKLENKPSIYTRKSHFHQITIYDIGPHNFQFLIK